MYLNDFKLSGLIDLPSIENSTFLNSMTLSHSQFNKHLDTKTKIFPNKRPILRSYCRLLVGKKATQY